MASHFAIEWSPNNSVWQVSALQDLSLPWPYFFPHAVGMPNYWPFLKNVVSLQNSVLWYILSLLAWNTLDPHWEDLAKYHLSSKTHLRENCHELPQLNEMSFSVLPPSLCLISSKALPAQHRASLLSCLSSQLLLFSHHQRLPQCLIHGRYSTNIYWMDVYFGSWM